MSQSALSRHSVDNRLPNEHDIQSANQLRRILATQMTEHETVNFTVSSPSAGSADIELGPLLNKLILDLLRAVGSGNTVISVPLNKKMTTQEAADVLNVSRPHLIKLLNNNEIPHEMVGRHRRVEARDVFLYKQIRDQERSKSLAELFRADSDLL